MMEEELQFALSQYMDGMLPADEVAGLEKRLAEDPAARRTLEEYRRLDMLMDVAMPTPQVNWDQMATRISRAIDAAAISPLIPYQEQPRASNILYRYRMNWQPVLLVASLLICATLVVVLTRRDASTLLPAMALGLKIGPTVAVVVARPPVASIEVLLADRANGTPSMDVQVGPSLIAQTTDIVEYYPEMVSSRPASVAIAGSPPAISDEDSGVLR